MIWILGIILWWVVGVTIGLYCWAKEFEKITLGELITNLIAGILGPLIILPIITSSKKVNEEIIIWQKKKEQ